MVQTICRFFFWQSKADGREGTNVKLFESLNALSTPTAALHAVWAPSIQMN